MCKGRGEGRGWCLLELANKGAYLVLRDFDGVWWGRVGDAKMRQQLTKNGVCGDADCGVVWGPVCERIDGKEELLVVEELLLHACTRDGVGTQCFWQKRL